MRILELWFFLLIFQVFYKLPISYGSDEKRPVTKLYESIDTAKTDDIKVSIDGNFIDAWSHYKKLYTKKYNDEKDKAQKNIFWKNVNKIKTHNSRKSNNFTMGINEFTDLSVEQFKYKISCLKNFVDEFLEESEISCSSEEESDYIIRKKLMCNFADVIFQNDSKCATSFNGLENMTYDKTNRYLFPKLPNYMDLRRRGYTTPVKYQLGCHSCYAHAVVGLIESYERKRNGEYLELSVQQVVDCSYNYNNCGCRGGNLNGTFKYILDYGLVPESRYPYDGRGGVCLLPKFLSNAHFTTIRGYLRISSNEEILRETLVNYGPVVTTINSEVLQEYESGIYEKICGNNYNNAAVILFGYGQTRDGLKYWIIKHSWGDDWGEYGYAKILRNGKNNCGIGLETYAPIFKKKQ